MSTSTSLVRSEIVTVGHDESSASSVQVCARGQEVIGVCYDTIDAEPTSKYLRANRSAVYRSGNSNGTELGAKGRIGKRVVRDK